MTYVKLTYSLPMVPTSDQSAMEMVDANTHSSKDGLANRNAVVQEVQSLLVAGVWRRIGGDGETCILWDQKQHAVVYRKSAWIIKRTSPSTKELGLMETITLHGQFPTREEAIKVVYGQVEQIRQESPDEKTVQNNLNEPNGNFLRMSNMVEFFVTLD